MKKSDAKPGTKVLASYGYDDEYGSCGEQIRKFHYDKYDDATLVGVIRSREASHDKVWVKWIEGDYAGKEEQEVSIKLLTLESDRNKIEEEFNNISKEIQNKMKEAAKLVKEANVLAKKTNTSLAEMYDAINPLINAMDSSGWRSSSWGC